MSKRLSPKQIEALHVLSERSGNAYSLRLNLGTLNAMSLRKLVASRPQIGAMFDPRVGIDWSITSAGRAAPRRTESRHKSRDGRLTMRDMPMERAFLDFRATAWEAAVLPLNYTRDRTLWR